MSAKMNDVQNNPVENFAPNHQMMSSLMDSIRALNSGKAPADVAYELSRSLAEIQSEGGTLRPLIDGAGDVIRELWDRHHHPERYEKARYKTDLEAFDDMVLLEPGDYFVIAARPSVGKTAFALNLALRYAKCSDWVVIHSLEMLMKQLAMRSLGIASSHNKPGGVPLKWMRQGTCSAANISELEKASSLLLQNIFVDEGDCRSLAKISSTLQSVKQKHGPKGLAIIDYIGLMSGDRKHGRTVELGDISKGFKHLAKELQVPMIVLSQLNRELEKRKDGRPRLFDLRDCGDIEQDADIVCLLHRLMGEGKSIQLIDGLVEKNRNGETGEIHFTFFPGVQNIVERKKAEEDE